MNKGTTKIKAISRRALEIREKAGFTTETIVKKRYKMAYVPDAIKQAAKELKTPGAEPLRRKLVSLEELKRQEAERIKEMKTKPKFIIGDKVVSKNSTLSNPRTITDRKFQSGIYFYEIQKGNFWKESDLILFVPKSSKAPKRTKRIVKTEIAKKSPIAKRKAKRTGTNSRHGMKVVDKKVSVSVSKAIEDILTLDKYSSIKPLAGGLLYSKFNNEKEVEVFPGEMAYSIFEKLEKMDYLIEERSNGSYKGNSRFSYQKDAITYSLGDKGMQFIKSVNARLETLKGKKFGYNLF